MIWNNLGISSANKVGRRASTLLAAITLWGMYFGILFGVEQSEGATDGVLGQFVLACLGSGLVLFARLANAVIVFLSSFERVCMCACAWRGVCDFCPVLIFICCFFPKQHRSHSATETAVLRMRLVMELVHYIGVFGFVFVTYYPFGVSRAWFRHAAPVIGAMFLSEAVFTVLVCVCLAAVCGLFACGLVLIGCCCDLTVGCSLEFSCPNIN